VLLLLGVLVPATTVATAARAHGFAPYSDAGTDNGYTSVASKAPQTQLSWTAVVVSDPKSCWDVIDSPRL
jgi:hypothetical protein